MRCEILTVDENTRAIVCSASHKRPHICDWNCPRISKYQCDFPVSVAANGKKTTCDRYLCDVHRNAGVTPGVDFCPEHFDLAKAAYERKLRRDGGKD
jgi:hypothetical protein